MLVSNASSTSAVKKKNIESEYRFLKVQNRRTIYILKIKIYVLWIIMSYSIWHFITFEILSQVMITFERTWNLFLVTLSF